MSSHHSTPYVSAEAIGHNNPAILNAAILFPGFGRARENARRASCQSNLKQIGLGFAQYTQDYDEKWPLLYYNVAGDSEGRGRIGQLTYRRQGKTEIIVEGLSEDDSAWLEDKVMNLIGHRRGGEFAGGDGKNPLTFAEGDNNAFGQLIQLNDGLGSEYRVKDGKVDEVTRTMGDLKFTITVLDTMTTEAGKYLANHFAVSYRDEKTNALQKVEGFRDSYAQLDGV